MMRCVSDDQLFSPKLADDAMCKVGRQYSSVDVAEMHYRVSSNGAQIMAIFLKFSESRKIFHQFEKNSLAPSVHGIDQHEQVRLSVAAIAKKLNIKKPVERILQRGSQQLFMLLQHKTSV